MLAVYLGVYLILPVCLCQTLAAFGVFVHESVEATSETTVSLLQENGTFPCHCEDHVCKNADVTQDWEECEQPTPDVFQSMLSVDSVRKSVRTDNDHSRAPPPPRIACSNSAAVFCVFLL